MKYLKVYNSIKYINNEHRELVNLAKRLEYNLRKYINSKVYVYAHYNHKTPEYTYYTEYDIAINYYGK